ncbi:hypothetical protein FF098_014630 [Parvularcula flava]|uniref:Uncharacterized protein n=1 Tax=Aquisalinus luteolus TaxID=1566827 RepID=A0A8J3A9G0_9PROT|nr:hypothetical protein [Aquisalinus luteolus]NHK29153.1 hypothetical protein [Aquisalinus luteolus]GGI00143.1 hypothetical protein GCM10011355_27740 [Aquisalinus luteolus]
MPTGYTADVQSGEITEFRDFALQCARAFGAAIQLRDSEPGPVPETLPNDGGQSYHVNALAEAKAELKQISGISPDEAEAKALAEYESACARYQEHLADVTAHRQRYESMLSNVLAWVPPSPDHEELKAFMASQLRESLKFDCTPYYDEPARLSGPEWLERSLAAARRDVDYHLREAEKERDRAASRQEWVDALYRSLED